jgi:Kdo2-lipid IVA lauroyltransferase/acyltransferase
MLRGHMPLALFAPRYWLTWLGLGFLWIIALLPYPAMMAVGRGLGQLVRVLAFGYVRVVRRNMELCLPELSPAAREALIKKHFSALGMALCESAMSCWCGQQRWLRRAQVAGLEHLDAAREKGCGVILLTAHFTTLEVGAALLNAHYPINVLYRLPKNPLLATLLHHYRCKKSQRSILHSDVRAMVRALRDNEVVWFAPDQSYRKKGAEMVPFFGVPAATHTQTSRLAQMTGASVLFFSHERLPNGQGYRVVIHPAEPHFPSADAVADTLHFNRFIEAEVRRIPEQYWWIHRRFKGLTADYPDYYGKTSLAGLLKSQ